MWETKSKVFKIIKAIANKSNNFTINLRDFYSKIDNISKDDIKIYCVPSKIQTIDLDTGYEIKINNNSDYSYTIINVSKGIINAPIEIANKIFIGKESESNYTTSFEIPIGAKYTYIDYYSYMPSEGWSDDANGFWLYIYVDDVLIKTINGDAIYDPYNPIYIREKIVRDNSITHTIKIKAVSTYTYGRLLTEYYGYIISSQMFDEKVNDESEIFCYFIIKEQ